jgi:hypothetical protein
MSRRVVRPAPSTPNAEIMVRLERVDIAVISLQTVSIWVTLVSVPR